MTLKVGQIWKDNDPRCPHRTIEIVEITSDLTVKVYCHQSGRSTYIKAWRFTRQTSRGYSLLKDAEGA